RGDRARTEIYTLSLHDALPISLMSVAISTSPQPRVEGVAQGVADQDERQHRAEQQPGREQQQAGVLEEQCLVLSDHDAPGDRRRDRKSTRLNSSHVKISYAVFC